MNNFFNVNKDLYLSSDRKDFVGDRFQQSKCTLIWALIASGSTLDKYWHIWEVGEF